MDFTSAMGAEFRDVGRRDRNGVTVRVVAAQRSYDTTPDDLWDAITNPARLPRWGLPIEGDLHEGGHYQIKGNASGRIERCVPPSSFEITWEFGGSLSWVAVRLTPEGERTRLMLEHAHPTTDEKGEAHWAQYGPGATGVGWDLVFAGLGLYLDSEGVAIDPSASDAWLASDAGKDFVRASAQAWGDAHIAGGEASDIATPMARRTERFYTGG